MRAPVFCSALVALLAAAARAQAPDPPPGPRADCATGPISYIFIDNHSIFDAADPELDRRFAWAYGVANALHVRTRRSVIRRELLFREGDCYEPALLEESERLLRAYDFLSRVDVFGVRQEDGSYHVVVDTQDQWSTQVDLRLRLDGGLGFEGVRLREANVAGAGQSLAFFYLERDVTRDYGIAYATPQLARTRWDLRAAAGRTRAGTFVTQTVAYPFVGEIGRWAARQSFAREDRFFAYVVDDDAGRPLHVLLPVRGRAADLALLRRFGRPGDLTLLGVALSYQRLAAPASDSLEVVHGSDFERRMPADRAFARNVERQRGELRALRPLLLLGKRNIAWVRRRGLDAPRGVQDVRLGAEAELALGPALPFPGLDDDLFAALSLYAGTAAGPWLGAARLRAEGRRALGTGPDWRDLLADGELLLYWKPDEPSRHTLVARAAAAGGWHTRTPFQLTLGGDRALRGYPPDRFPGGRRLVFTLEDRIFFGWPLPDVLDLGGTLFLDFGRIWPGDAPFGIDSRWRATAGIGLRGALPAGGRTTYRLDLAFPLGPGPSDARLLLSVGELIGLAAQPGDDQMLRSRRVGISGDLFHFPN